MQIDFNNFCFHLLNFFKNFKANNQAEIIYEEKIRLKEEWREKVKESIEATRKKLEERRKTGLSLSIR